MKVALLLLSAALAALCIDLADQFNTDSGRVKTTPIYHASLIIEGQGKVVHVDPTSKANYKGLPKADLILITQDHPEHLDAAGIANVSRKTTAILAPVGPAAKLPRCTPISNGESVSFGDISIQAVPAYKPGEEKGKVNGYILTFPGLRVYVSGDTGLIPEMKTIRNLDVAFIAMGTPDTMPLEEAAEVIRLLKPKTVYPNHYRETNEDDLRKKLQTGGVEIRIRHWY